MAQDVQERITHTFQQTLDLVNSQRDQEALVGCEFILRMDPRFQPAKTLVARLKSGERPVAVDDLRAPQSLDADLGDLGDLDDLGSLDDFDDLADLALDDDDTVPAGSLAIAVPTPAAAPTPASASSGLAAVVADLLARRNFEQILQIAEKQQQSVASDPQVSALVEKARGLAESEAYVQAFLKSARRAQAAGRLDQMESYLKKASALDAEHPDVVGFAAEAEPPAAGAVAADDDLMALQQQSLSLEAGAPGAVDPTDQLAEELARDPRQTKPMAAVPLGDGTETTAAAASDEAVTEAAIAAGEPDFEGALFDESGEAEVLDDLGAELFDDEDFGEPPVEAEVEEDLGAELFDGEGEMAAADVEALDELSAELTLDAGGVPEEAAESGDRVGQLLEEGQEAFDGGDYQAAIDVWSRIFLIEIDNQEASRRIEEARGKKAELERQAEELFHEAVGQIEKGSIDDAKDTLARVLELAPSHSLAREYAEQLEAGQVPATSGDLDLALAEDAGELGAAPEAEAGSPSLEAAVERDRVVLVKKTDRRLILLGAGVLLAVIVAGAFLMLQWDDLFPNQDAPPTMAQARKVDPIERATKMHEGGNTENAILMLERIQPQDPVYEDAQALIAQWKALVEAPPEPEDLGPSKEQVARHTLLVNAARGAYRQGRHIRALKYYEQAVKILPLEAGDQAFQSESERRLAPLGDEMSLFANGEYVRVIPILWRKRELEPDNLDIQRLLVDSYYNLALTDMQRGNVQEAAKKLREALEVQPDNQELQRLQLFAQTYTQRRRDLLYRIFVKYLPSR